MKHVTIAVPTMVGEVVEEASMFFKFMVAGFTGRLNRIDSYTIMEPVAGVTFDGRQDIIASLKVNAPCSLVHAPTSEFPYRTEVHIGNKVVGYLPDNPGMSIAKILIEKSRRGKDIRVGSWVRVGGAASMKYGLRLAIEIEK